MWLQLVPMIQTACQRTSRTDSSCLQPAFPSSWKMWK